MAVKVLVVDDSAFYRRQLSMVLSQDRDLIVVGEAVNGQEAVDKVRTLNPDVVTMDVEMPVMDGISAVKQIMASTPVPIMMFSSLTHEGAQATLDALESGALDFLPKRFEDVSVKNSHASKQLITKLKIISRRKPFMRRPLTSRSAPAPTTPSRTGAGSSVRPAPPAGRFLRSSSVLTGQKNTSEQISVSSVTRSGKHYRFLAIGASTGGPVALQTVLSSLPEHFPVPILVVQHMPGTFTEAFAQRLDGQCKIKVQHAESGMRLENGCAYIAPGGKQCVVVSRGGGHELQIRDTLPTEQVNYKPSVDISLQSVAQTYGGDVLALILTGMGADGREGCRQLKSKSATIWAQDQASCVVYGMPQAVASAGLSSNSIGIEHIASCIITEMVRA